LQILGAAIAFMQPPPTTGQLAVVSAPDDPASRRGAEAIAGASGLGLKIGSVMRWRLTAWWVLRRMAGVA
jgi:hypothetical protein